MSATAAIVLGATAGICAIIVIIILLACSYGKVEMNEVGLLYSHASRRIDRERLYTAGRYYVGVGGEFIKYELTQQEMELPVFESRTQDGLKIEMQVSLNFKLQKDDFHKILDLFDHFGQNYTGFISRLAMNVIRDVSAEFTAFEYSVNRSLVSLKMETDIRDDMSEIGFDLESVQLLNVDFPANYASNLSATLMLQQRVTQALREKEAELVSLEGEKNNSAVEAQGIIYDAQNEYTGIVEKADADAKALNNTLVSEGISHRMIIDMFLDEIMAADNSTTPTPEQLKRARDLFVQWYWMNQLANTPATKNIAVGIPSSFVNMP